MSSKAETQSSLALRRWSEIRIAHKAVWRCYGNDEPALSERLLTEVNSVDSAGTLGAIYTGEVGEKVRWALLYCVLASPVDSGQELEQAAAAKILRIDLELLGVRTQYQGENTASMPHLVPNRIA